MRTALQNKPGQEVARVLHLSLTNVYAIKSRLLKEINTRELDLYRQKSDRFPTEQGHRLELGVRLRCRGSLPEAVVSKFSMPVRLLQKPLLP